MPAIKALGKISELWAKRAAGAKAEYKEGVENPRRNWEEAAQAKSETYRLALEESFGRDAYTKGLEGKNSRWQSKASKLGPGRYSEGVRDAESDYRSGFAPFHARIQATTLPPGGPKGSPENIERVRVMAEALHNEKIGA